AFDAYLVMVRSNPSRWLDDWWIMRPRLNRLIASIRQGDHTAQQDRLSERAQQFFIWLGEALPAFDVAAALPHVQLTPTIEQRDSDDWLVSGLFEAAGPYKLVWEGN